MGRIRGIDVELEKIPDGFLAWLPLPRVRERSRWAVRDLEFPTEHDISCGTYGAAAMRALLERAPDACMSRRFFRGAPTTDWDAIYTYEDFLCSACDFLCLCVDAYYFELYMKDEEEIREVLHQLGSLSGAQVALKTDETDGRYRMTID